MKKEKVIQICSSEEGNPILLTSLGRILKVIITVQGTTYVGRWVDITPKLEVFNSRKGKE